jgi:hypothetical protein
VIEPSLRVDPRQDFAPVQAELQHGWRHSHTFTLHFDKQAGVDQALGAER